MKKSVIIPLLALPGALMAEEMPSSRPNIVYILADDLGIGDLGCYGQQVIKTPAIDQLARDGMRFTNHYAGTTVSAPSRCSLLTGKHTGHTWIRGNLPGLPGDIPGYDMPLASSEITLADVLKQADYATACVGKWGLGGPGSMGAPDKHGFDYFFGYLGQGNAHKYYPAFLWENDRKIQLDKKVYSHDMIVEKALEFIDRSADKPFLLFFTPTLPHAELIVPPGELGEYDGMFEERPFVNKNGKGYCSQPKPRATYAAMVSRLDRAVELIVEKLREKGLLENTIILFSSDNGVHAEGGHDPDFFASHSLYRGIKRDMYDGGIHTPLIVRWDRVVKPGTLSDHQSAFWDFMPTVCEITGLPVPKKTDGISMLPTLTGKGSQKTHDYLYFEFHERGGRQCLITRDNWKIVRLNINKGKQTVELYNLNEDPSEKNNVLNKYPALAKKLLEKMRKARTRNPYWNFSNI